MNVETRSNNRFVAIDLELEQPNGSQVTDSRSETPVIIQLGVVAFELAPDDIVVLEQKTFHIRYEKGLSTYIKTLTSINDEDLRSPECETTLDAFNELVKIIKTHKTSHRIVEWGSGDLQELRESSGLTLDDAFNAGVARNTVNVRVLFDLYMMSRGIRKTGGLRKAMKLLGLKFASTRYKGKHKGSHWAESDALNTAKIFNKLMSLLKSIP